MNQNAGWKSCWALMLALAATGAWAQSQQQAAPAKDGAQCMAGMKAGGASLSPEQKQKLGELRMKERDQAAVIRHDSSLSEQQKQAQLQQLREATHEQMKGVLTPEQQKKFAALRQSPQQRMAAELGLTAEQQSKLAELRRSHHEQRQSVLANSTLSQEQKLAELSKIRQSGKEQMEAILTPEQRSKMQQMRQSRMHRGPGENRQ